MNTLLFFLLSVAIVLVVAAVSWAVGKVVNQAMGDRDE